MPRVLAARGTPDTKSETKRDTDNSQVPKHSDFAEQSSSFLALGAFPCALHHCFERSAQPINMTFLLKQGAYLQCHHH